MQQYDKEACQAMRETVERVVEYAQLNERWDETARELLTPYLLFHVLDTLERIEKQLGDTGDMVAQQWGYTKEEDAHE